jgi:hypothetical protein
LNTEDQTTAIAIGRIEAKIEERDKKLDAIHQSLKDDIAGLEERTNGRLDRIEKQTTATNGRVKDGELKDARLEGMFKVFALASPFMVAAFASAIAYFLK